MRCELFLHRFTISDRFRELFSIQPMSRERRWRVES